MRDVEAQRDVDTARREAERVLQHARSAQRLAGGLTARAKHRGAKANRWWSSRDGALSIVLRQLCA